MEEQPSVDLSGLARLRQIDREVVALRVGLAGFRWAAFPGLGVAGALILHRIVEAGAPSLSALVTALVGAITGGVVLVQAYQRSRENLDDLLRERAALAEKSASHAIASPE